MMLSELGTSFWTRGRLVVALVGCALPGGAAAQSVTFENTGWMLQSVGMIDARSLNVDMRATNGTFGGGDGCNRITTSYQIDRRLQSVTIKTAPMMSTMMACSGLADQVSRTFRTELAAVRAYRISGNELRLVDAAGKTRAVYMRQVPTLTGVRWSLFGLNTGTGVESSARVEPVWLRFGTNGRAQVFTGCRTISVVYRHAAKGAISFDPRSFGKQAHCSARGDIGAVHRFVLQALSKTRSWSRMGNRLELRSADGAMQFAGSSPE